MKVSNPFNVMLCEEGTEADLDKEGYVAELKVDGVRCIAERVRDGLRIYSRNGTLWTASNGDKLK